MTLRLIGKRGTGVELVSEGKDHRRKNVGAAARPFGNVMHDCRHDGKKKVGVRARSKIREGGWKRGTGRERKKEELEKGFGSGGGMKDRAKKKVEARHDATCIKMRPLKRKKLVSPLSGPFFFFLLSPNNSWYFFDYREYGVWNTEKRKSSFLSMQSL